MTAAQVLALDALGGAGFGAGAAVGALFVVDDRHHRQCATFSSGEGFGTASDGILLWKRRTFPFISHYP